MAARQAPLSLGFSRQEQWSGLPFPSPVHERKSEVTQSLHDPMDCSLPGSSIHGIFQARVLEWGAIAFSKFLYIYAFELWRWRRLLTVPWTARRSNQSIPRKSTLNIHWKDWCWTLSSSTMATWCQELTHWKRKWQATPVFRDRGAWWAAIYGVAQSRTRLKRLSSKSWLN